MIGAVEAGGTKIVCAAGSQHDDLTEERFPTTAPSETIARIREFFERQQAERGEKIEAIGIGTFGPAAIDPDSPTFGHITTTPKAGWQHTDFAGPLRDAFHVPVAFDTDVNAAAIGEGKWGAARETEDFIYLTVGTGIGGGIVTGGRIVHGRMHPEIGHLLLPRDRAEDPFDGVCPFHGDCFEGLASGPAIGRRWNVASAAELPADHPAWELEARYLALACFNLTVSLSPRMIILGGGVMVQRQLFPLVEDRLRRLANGYLEIPEIVPPGLGNRSGVLGAFGLADALLRS